MNLPTLFKYDQHNYKSQTTALLSTALKAVAISSLMAASAYAAAPIRTLISEGNVSITNNESGRKLPLKTGQTLEEGVTIATGAQGSCVLVFSSGSALRLAPNSSLNIADYEQPNSQTTTTELTLAKGEALSNVKKQANSSYKIGTPAGNVKVTGTTFSVNYDDGSDTTTVSTSEGSVQLSFSGNVLSVPAGYSASSQGGDLSKLLEDKGLNGYAFQQALEAATQAGASAQATALSAGLSSDEASQFGNTAAATAFSVAWNSSTSLEPASEASIAQAAAEAAQSVISVFNQIIAAGTLSTATANANNVLAQVSSGIDIENVNIATEAYRSTVIETHKTTNSQLPVQISPL